MLDYVFCWNLQRWHWTFQETFQSCQARVIDAPTKVQTKQRLCLTIRCQWIQLELGQLDIHEDEIGWPNTLDWQNFECWTVPSNLSSRLIHGSFGWGCVAKTHPKEIETWLVCKWIIISWSVWFSCSRFLKTTRISSMAINMIMKTMKYDANKRWVIHNLNQQEVGNPQLLGNFSFEDEG